MRAKGYMLIRTVFVLTLVVLSLVSGPTLMAGNTVSGIGAYASGTHESVYDESTQAGGPTCVAVSGLPPMCRTIIMEKQVFL